MLEFTWEVDDVLTDATSVQFNDPTSTYGLRRVDTQEIIVAAGEDWDHPATGTYQYDEDALGLVDGVTYEYWIEVFFDGDYSRYKRTFMVGDGGEETPTQALIRFVVVKDGAFQVLEDPPEFSSPSADYGLVRDDTGEEILADGTNLIASGARYAYAFTAPDEDLVYRYYIEAVVDEVTYFVARTTQYVTDANLVLGRYTDSTRIELMFGGDNVHKWLALNDRDSPIDYALREYQIIKDAEQWIDDRLKGSFISEAFTEDIPAIIQQIATEIAGVMMYEARGITDTNPVTGAPQHKYRFIRDRAEARLKDLKYGKIKVATSASRTSHPEIPECP